MSTLITGATGNFTAAGTWFLCDPTSESDVETNVTSSTISFVGSSNFAPGAITINALAIKISTRSAAPTGTFTIELFNSTLAASVANTTTTINVSDLSVSPDGWYVFPTTGSVLLLAANNYQIRIKTSVSAEVSPWRDATGGNWSRQLRTTTTQAPVAGDKLIVVGEHTGVGTGNSFAVTMDETATTSYGATAFLQSINVGKRAVLAYGTAAGTNYYLKFKGVFKVTGNGELDIGTSGTPIPSTSSAVLEMDSTANVDTGLVINPLGTFTTFGNALSFDRAFLAADAAAAATSLTTDVSTGWLSGDTIALASTTRTASECESKALSANAVGTALTIAAITSAHSGTAPTAGELANLTRNVKIRGTASNLQGYVYIQTTSTVSCSWTEHMFLGSATSLKRGVDITTSTGSCTYNRCSFRAFIVTGAIGLNINSGTANNITITNNVMHNLHTNCINFPTPSSGTVLTFTNNLMILNQTTTEIMQLVDVGGTITNNTAVGSGRHGISLSDTNGVFGTCSGNIAHSNTSTGFITNAGQNGSALIGGTMSSTTAWRNGSTGLNISGNVGDVLFDGLVAFGNATQNVSLGGSTAGQWDVTYNNFTLNAGTTLTCPVGILVSADIENCYVTNSNIGTTTTHATGDVSIIQPAATAFTLVELFFRNTVLASATEVANTAFLAPGSYLGFEKHDGVAGSHKAIKGRGVVTIDTVIFDGVSPSQRLTPNSASFKLKSRVWNFQVTNGTALTPTIRTRKSAAGDGTAYNGNQPRLMLKANQALGINSDVTIATMSVATGNWETLTGTTATVTDDGTLSFYVDCDGTLGWVNVDNLTCTVPDSSGFKYWRDGEPQVSGTTATGSGGAFTFVS